MPSLPVRRAFWLCVLVLSSCASRVDAPAKPVVLEPIPAELLAVWRKPGRIDGGAACAACHSPDGLELARWAFDDATIVRRALPHLDADDATKLVEFVHAVRRRYGITTPLDPMRDRPLQPGGEVLPGTTPVARDLAFAKELARRLPVTMESRVATREEAHAVRDELLALDVWNLPIGIEGNRVSEDKFHGADHASLAHWIADLPVTASRTASAQWFEAQDRYLAEPSRANLQALLDLTWVEPKRVDGPAVALLANQKYRSVLVLAHLLREELVAGKRPSTPVFLPRSDRSLCSNPFWEVGDFARPFVTSKGNPIGMEGKLLANKTGGPDLGAQMLAMELPWMWLGWLCEQGMQRTSLLRQTQRGDYMVDALWNQGPYAMHAVFWCARRMLVHSFVREAWNDPRPQHFAPGFSALTRNGFHLTRAPQDPEHRRLYEAFCCAVFRATLHLLDEDLERTNVVYVRDAMRQQTRDLAAYVDRCEPDRAAETARLLGVLLDRIERCEERVP